NREEGGARKAEVEAEALANGGQRLSAPVELDGAVVGMAELVAPPPPAAASPSALATLLAFALPLPMCVGASFVVRRQGLLVAVTAVLFAAGLGGYAVWSLNTLAAELRGVQQAVGTEVREQSARAKALLESQGLKAEPAWKAGAWDADAFRRPLGLVSDDG